MFVHPLCQYLGVTFSHIKIIFKILINSPKIDIKYIYTQQTLNLCRYIKYVLALNY